MAKKIVHVNVDSTRHLTCSDTSIGYTNESNATDIIITGPTSFIGYDVFAQFQIGGKLPRTYLLEYKQATDTISGSVVGRATFTVPAELVWEPETVLMSLTFQNRRLQTVEHTDSLYLTVADTLSNPQLVYPGIPGYVPQFGHILVDKFGNVVANQRQKLQFLSSVITDDAVNDTTVVQGVKGDQGEIGLQGLKGDPGPRGIQGLRGETGVTGPQGSKGDTGDAGPMGPQGSQGEKGVSGEIGPQGLKGDSGDIGATGPPGPQGVQGEQGPKGDTGDVGPVGPQGPQGEKGISGEVGPQGPKGDDSDLRNIADGTEIKMWKGSIDAFNDLPPDEMVKPGVIHFIEEG